MGEPVKKLDPRFAANMDNPDYIVDVRVPIAGTILLKLVKQLIAAMSNKTVNGGVGTLTEAGATTTAITNDFNDIVI